MGSVLSLFDGMSCLQIALKELGITPSRYYASEIDKYAMQVTQHNFPDTIQLGDITKWREWDIDWADILLIGAGSPCQGFSFAGKQLAFDDPRSKLFFVFVEILNHVRSVNPDVIFLLENVRMKKEHQAVITEMVGVEPLAINSNLVSAQNRYRLYWTNIGTIPQPIDKGLLLSDILEEDVDECFYLNNPKVGFMGMDLGKKCNTMRTGGSSSQSKKHNHDLICVAMRGRNIENPSDRTKGIELEQRLEPNTTGKTNCLSTVSKDNLIMQINPCLESGGKQPYQQNRVYDTDGITPALCANKADLLINERQRNNLRRVEEKANTFLSTSWKGSQANGMTLIEEHHPIQNNQEHRIRRLTPTECKRLQTVPEWYDMGVISNTQKYRVLGNGWTVEVIKHILNQLNNGN
jgi:DNA-cytosine methyltransferase